MIGVWDGPEEARRIGEESARVMVGAMVLAFVATSIVLLTAFGSLEGAIQAAESGADQHMMDEIAFMGGIKPATVVAAKHRPNP